MEVRTVLYDERRVQLGMTRCRSPGLAAVDRDSGPASITNRARSIRNFSVVLLVLCPMRDTRERDFSFA
jgi:hypothetical protein